VGGGGVAANDHFSVFMWGVVCRKKKILVLKKGTQRIGGARHRMEWGKSEIKERGCAGSPKHNSRKCGAATVKGRTQMWRTVDEKEGVTTTRVLKYCGRKWTYFLRKENSRKSVLGRGGENGIVNCTQIGLTCFSGVGKKEKGVNGGGKELSLFT